MKKRKKGKSISIYLISISIIKKEEKERFLSKNKIDDK